jgi:hypothetical protein
MGNRHRTVSPSVPTRFGGLASICSLALLLSSTFAAGAPITVRHAEGLVHGFLILRAMDGAPLADGDLQQTAQGDRVTIRLTFRFKDGSLHDETAVFSQRGNFRLITDHLIQKGPSFPRPLDLMVDAASGRVTVRYTDDGTQKVADERLALQPDLANGLMPTLLKNVGADVSQAKVTMVAATPKPRVVTLAVSRAGEDMFHIGGATHQATHYVVKVEIGGLSGLVAPLVGKQPPDTHVWILGGDVPAFLKSEGPLYNGGPPWRIELTSPVWPRPNPGRTAAD